MEKVNMNENLAGSVSRGASSPVEGSKAEGFYKVECFDQDGNLKWEDEFSNVVTTEGKTTAIFQYLKGSAYTAAQVMGLITATGYTTAPAVGNTAANIATTSSPNGWNEAPTATCAARQSITFGTPAAGSVSISPSASFSIVGTDTIKGVFVSMKSTAGTAPVTTVASTAGALYSAGLFSADKAVSNGDTLSVTYTTSLT